MVAADVAAAAAAAAARRHTMMVLPGPCACRTGGSSDVESLLETAVCFLQLNQNLMTDCLL